MNELTAPSMGRTAAAPRRAGRWLLVLVSAALLIAACLAWRWLDHGTPLPVEITIDGEHLAWHGQLESLPWTDKAALAAGIAVAAITLPLALATAVLAVLAALLVVLLLAVALPLALGAAVLLALLSPLWVLAWLLWRAVVPRRSGTIAA